MKAYQVASNFTEVKLSMFWLRAGASCGDKYKTFFFSGRARSCKTGYGKGDVCAAALKSPDRHFFRYSAAYRPMLLDRLWGDTEKSSLCVIRIDYEAAFKTVADAREIGEQGRQEPACATFCGGNAKVFSLRRFQHGTRECANTRREDGLEIGRICHLRSAGLLARGPFRLGVTRQTASREDRSNRHISPFSSRRIVK